MNLVEFFQRVCPRTHSIVVVQYNSKTGTAWNREQFTYDQIEEIAPKIEEWDKNPNATIYYSVGAFADNVEEVDGKEKIRRTKDKVRTFRSLAFDLDIGEDKPYKTREEGLMKLVEVVKELRLPKPMIVGSGQGAHVYWPLMDDVDSTLWERVSIALCHALTAKGLLIDTSKIHDTSMVLRPVGTYHKKQEPWKPVSLILDSGESHDITVIYGKVKDFEPRGLQHAPKREKRSKLLDAVLGEEKNDLDVDVIAENCKQISALLESGGVLDAEGNPVEEPLWRASLGIAKFTPDPEATIIKLAGQHPDFDLDLNVRKLEGWKGTGPTTCAKFEELCGGGCMGCPYRGQITSPAQLNTKTEIEVEEVTASGEVKKVKVDMPDGYIVRNDWIYQEVTDRDEDGNIVRDFRLVSPYNMYIKDVFYNPEERRSAFTLAIEYPIRGWVEEDHDADIVSLNGAKFSEFLTNAQLWNFKTTAQKEGLRCYLVDYLTMVQQRQSTGYDYTRFGWQKDGSFLCGETIINAPHGSTSRRVMGDAKGLLKHMHTRGSRDEYVRALRLLMQTQGSIIAQACILLGTTGVIAKYVGNGSSMVSIYSPETTTGKTFILMCINSLVGHPKELIQNSKDTNNAVYKTRGTFNNIAMVIDEMTMSDPEKAADMAYAFSEGKEKKTLTANREARDPATWDGLTVLTTNSSMLTKYDQSNQSAEPLRVRTLELPLHERTMISAKGEDGEFLARTIVNIMFDNYGHALPELVQAVINAGGAQEVARKGITAFRRKFDFEFDPQERFYESAIISAWIMGKLGNTTGIIPFNVDEVINYLLAQVIRLRKDTEDNRQDAIDIIGQFMQEYNDQIVEVTREYGADGKEIPRPPAPMKAVMRMTCVYDAKHPILPGSTLAINKAAFKKFLTHTSFEEDKVLRELETMGALVSPRERVTLFKGCSNRNPGQAWCIIVNLNHPRFTDALAGATYKKQSPVSMALLTGLQETSHA